MPLLPDIAADQPTISRADIRQQGAVSVRAATLMDDEGEHYLGASLADQWIAPAILRCASCRSSPMRPMSQPQSSKSYLVSGGGAAPMRRSHRHSRAPHARDHSAEANRHQVRLYASWRGVKLLQIGLGSSNAELLFRFILPIAAYAIGSTPRGSAALSVPMASHSGTSPDLMT